MKTQKNDAKTSLEALRKYIFSAATLLQNATGELSDADLSLIEDDCLRAGAICGNVLSRRAVVPPERVQRASQRNKDVLTIPEYGAHLK